MRFVAIGNANIDVTVFLDRIPEQDEAVDALAAMMTSGGSASNFALAASRLGVDVSIIVSVGDDSLGQIYMRSMREGGVDVDHVKIVDGRRTGLVVIINVLGESRRMIESPGANLELTPKDILEREDLIKRSREVHMASVEIPIARAVSELRHDVSWDPGARILAKSSYEAWKLLSGIGKIFLNEKESRLLSRESDPETAAKKIAKEGPDEVIIKLGPKGSLAWADGELCFVEAVPIKVVDTTGAGDVFAATYLVSRNMGFSPEKSIRLANAAAALTISRPGTAFGLPVWDEIAAMEFISYGKSNNRHKRASHR